LAAVNAACAAATPEAGAAVALVVVINATKLAEPSIAANDFVMR
jgi:hypothetical protein